MTAARGRVPAGLLLLTVLVACRAEPRTDASPQDGTSHPANQRAFFDNIRAFCGQRFAGATEIATAPDHPQPDVPLVMHVRDCDQDEIRIPFLVGEDRSRTWILRISQAGLLFKHDHRHEDGTPEDLTNYGGWAAEDGTPTLQRFPADEETARMLPAAATNVWTLELDTATGRFIYDLQRDGQPRFRASFDLTRTIADETL